jgi:hypothetical protein
LAQSLQTPEKIRTLQRKLYLKAKAEPGFRFYLLYDKIHRDDILAHAYALARANGGAPGVDGMTVADLRSWIAENRERLIVSLLDGSYRPQPVRGVEIPKPGGGMRQLGIPTVVDRLVQRRLRKPWNRCSTRRSRRRASASARGVGRTTPCDRPGSTWPTGTRSSRTSTWKSSSTG